MRVAALAGLPGSLLLALGIYSLSHPAAALHPVLGERNVAVSLTVAGAMTLIWGVFRVAMSSRDLMRRARTLRTTSGPESGDTMSHES